MTIHAFCKETFHYSNGFYRGFAYKTALKYPGRLINEYLQNRAIVVHIFGLVEFKI